MKNIVNVALLKEKRNERKQSTKKFTTLFTIVELANFYQFSTRFVDSNRKQEVTQHLRFVMKNIVNVALLKEKRKERKQSTKKFTTFFIIVELANFYQFSTRFTTNIILFALLSICHINKCKKFCQFFFFCKKKKILRG